MRKSTSTSAVGAGMEKARSWHDTILQRQTEDYSLSHTIDRPQPPAQPIQKTAKQKQERFHCFDLAIEIKCLRIFRRGTDQTKQALVASGYLAAQDFGGRAKALDDFRFWQGKKFANATNSPAVQNLQKILPEVRESQWASELAKAPAS